MNNQGVTPGLVLRWVGAVAVVCVACLLLLGGCGAAVQSYGRYQQRQDKNQARQQRIYDAENQTEVNHIQISQNAQKVLIAKQQANIRYQNAVGIREAQDEIAKTLTPLYVQFEYTQALEQIATSGKNNSVVYVPTNPQGGLPTIVPTTNAVHPTP